MYAYIDGKVTDVENEYIVLENNGIGYSILVDSQSMSDIISGDKNVRIYTYYHVTENTNTLFGFLTKEKKDFFLKLITVNGIGPKGAISILGSLSVEQLRMAILSNDAKMIAKAPGIGAKTAQRMILDLKDKISTQMDLEYKSLDFTSEEKGAKSDAIVALTSLGYSYAQAATAVKDIQGDLSVEEILKQALKNIN